MARDRGVLVIFDLVSTLTDAGPRYVQAFLETTEKAGFGTPDADEVMEMLGNKNLSEITDAFAGGMDAEKKKEFMQECNQSCDALLARPGWKEKLFPHVREAIETMHLRGVTLGIYTGTREDAMEAQLKYHRITGMFDTRYMRGKDNARDAGKKNPELKEEQLRAIVEAFREDQKAKGNSAPAVIVIGDSEADEKAAEKLGLFFVGFAVNDKKRDALSKAGVKTFVSDFGQVPDLIDRLMRPPANDPAPKPGMGRQLKP